MTTFYFSAPQPTIELAQSLYEPAVFNPAGVFQTPDGFVLALLRDMNWPPQGAAEAIKRATGYSMVSCCDPLLSVWRSYPFQKPVAPDGANVPREDDTERRLAAPEAAVSPAIASQAQMPKIENRRIRKMNQALQAVIRDCADMEDRLDRLGMFENHVTKRLDALEAAATPAIANRAWMNEIEQRLAVLREQLDGLAERLDEVGVGAGATRRRTPAPVGYQHAAIRRVRCDYCSGSGEYHGGMCRLCDGSGYIREMPREDDE